MIDRAARNHMIEVVESFMNDQVTSYAIEDLVVELIESKSEDEAVQFACAELFSFFDDFKEHEIVVNRDGWNFLNRLLLLLKSEAELSVDHHYDRWTARHKLAACLLVGYIVAVVMVGFSMMQFLVFVPFWFATQLLGYWESYEDRKQIKSEAYRTRTSLYPFNSVSELLRVRRAVCGFNKKQYPPHLKNRRLRSGAEKVFMKLSVLLGSIVAMPVYLLFFSTPESKTGTRVDLADSHEARDCSCG